MPIRSGCTATILPSCLLSLLLAMPPACSRLEPTVERTLDFPADRSLGRLWIVEEKPSFLSGSGEFDQGDARGRLRIVVPAGWQLELRVSAQGATDLSGLSRLKADDLWGLSFHGTPSPTMTSVTSSRLRGYGSWISQTPRSRGQALPISKASASSHSSI